MPGESPQRGVVGYSPQGHKESDTTEWLRTAQHRQGLLGLMWYSENGNIQGNCRKLLELISLYVEYEKWERVKVQWFHVCPTTTDHL